MFNKCSLTFDYITSVILKEIISTVAAIFKVLAHLSPLLKFHLTQHLLTHGVTKPIQKGDDTECPCCKSVSIKWIVYDR